METPTGVSIAALEQTDGGYRVKLPAGNTTLSNTGKPAGTLEGAALVATLELFSGWLCEAVAAQFDCEAGANHLNS